MSLRYLVGPAIAPLSRTALCSVRESRVCITFGRGDTADVAVGQNSSWDDIRAQLPQGWEPDFLVINLAAGVPRCLWNQPLPRVGLATNWHLSWHLHRERLRQCDLVWTDSLGVETLACEGIRSRSVNLFDLDPSIVTCADGGVATKGGLRDIDLLFVGNLNPVLHKNRASWLARLARLGNRWRVRIRAGIPQDEYRRLLLRTRIVFQHSSRGKAGRGAFEAAHCGALVFQESGNRELPAWFRDRQECAYFDANNFEELVHYYLEHEEERQTLAEAARIQARNYRFEDAWKHIISETENEWPTLRDRAGFSRLVDPLRDLSMRAWEALLNDRFEDNNLLADLERRTKSAPEDAHAANLMGCMLWRQARGRAPVSVTGVVASGYFQKAIDVAPTFALAGLNLAESLDAAGNRPAAIQVARETQATLQRFPELDAASAEGFPLCQAFDAFHVGWEEAAWKAAGHAKGEARAKRDLILWKLHGLLASWTGDLDHSYESVLRNPDSLIARAALGENLARVGRHTEAIEHLRVASAANPLDRYLPHALVQSLSVVKDTTGRENLCEERRLITHAAPQIVPMEAWYAPARPKGTEITSVIVRRKNRLEISRECLIRVFGHSREPFELVLVDDGSFEDTASLVHEFRRKRGTNRVDFLRAVQGASFAQVARQAAARAQGRFLAFLDDSAFVTPGWLDCLFALSVHDWPNTGLVGPATDQLPGSLGISVAKLEELDRLAAHRRRKWAGQMSPTNQVPHFCFLLRREILERVGEFDTRFTTDPMVVADYCLRVRESGLRVLIAQDAFVHREADLPPEPKADTDLRVLRDKWGDQLSTEFAPVAPKAGDDGVPTPNSHRISPVNTAQLAPLEPGVSLCMIVKNEEKNLPECLSTVHDLFDEIIVIDTGSSDRTRDAAQRFGAKIFDFPWVDSFGAARNESLRHATRKWIMWLDADDRLDAENRNRLRKVLSGLGDERDAYAIIVRSVLDPEKSSFRLLDQVRIFRNLPEIRWDYRIHEQILPSVNKAGGTVRWTDVVVDHVGYQDQSLRMRKLERNLRLLQMDDADRPDDSFTLFNFGWTMLDLGMTAEALPRLQRSLATAKPDSSILRKLYHLLAVAHRHLGDRDTALKFCRDGLNHYPDDAELLLEEGLMLRDRGDLAGAEASWSRLLEPRHGKYFSSEDVGLRGYRTRQLLAEIFVSQERWTEAELQWRAALADRIEFEPAWMGLADFFLKTSRHGDLTELLQRLDDGGIKSPKLGWLKARSQIQRREYAEARKTLVDVISLDPNAIGPRVLLTQALLQEGRDWSAAERALLDVLEIDPNNKDAKHNLKVLRQQKAMRKSGSVE